MPRGHKHSIETRMKIGEASRRPKTSLYHDAERQTPDDYMDKSMTADDFVYVLENLRFQGSYRLGTLQLDKYARDYILDALRRRHPPSSA
jgi:hypothetical protein